MTIFSDLAQGANNIRLNAKIHSQVGSFPVTKHTYTHKVFALAINLPHGIVAALLTEGRVVDFNTSLARFLFNIVLNG